MSRPTRFQSHLKEIVTEIFDLAFDPDVCGYLTEVDLAAKAGLASPTINRLRRGETKEPRHSTIFKLAKAIKMDLGLLEEALVANPPTKKRREKQHA